MRRIVLFGNSGSGKTTMARELARKYGLAHLDLDSLAWSRPGVRMPVAMSAERIRMFVDEHPEWVIEGCYGDLLEEALSFASEVRFLNPGVEQCVANCQARPWEPKKYAARVEQDRLLGYLLAWVREYETRDDEYSLARHRKLFDRFAGPKEEIVSLPDRGTDPSRL
jgi:adenylate kinase family enzyme